MSPRHTERQTDRLNQFWEWVERAMAERDLSFRQIERQANVANSTISKRARLKMEPTKTTYEVLSQALGVTIRDLMVRAGRIETVDNAVSDSDFFRIMEALERMTPKEVKNIARYIEFQFPEVYEAVKQLSEEEGEPEPTN